MECDNERIKRLLTETVTLLCKNSITYSDELRVEGLVGVSVDKKEVFFVHICKEFSKRRVSSTVAAAPSTLPLFHQDSVEDEDETDATAAPSGGGGRPKEPEIVKKSLAQSSHSIKVETYEDDECLIIEDYDNEPEQKPKCTSTPTASAIGHTSAERSSHVHCQAYSGGDSMAVSGHYSGGDSMAVSGHYSGGDSVSVSGHYSGANRKRTKYGDEHGRQGPPKKRALQLYEETYNAETSDDMCWPGAGTSAVAPITIYPTTLYDHDSDTSLVSTEDGTRSDSASWSDLSQIPESVLSSTPGSQDTPSHIKLLRCRLLQRRASQPETHVLEPSPPPQPLDLSTLDRKEIRRYQNRVAAQKSRAKKRAEAARVYTEYQKVLKTNSEIQEKLIDLLKEREDYIGTDASKKST